MTGIVYPAGLPCPQTSVVTPAERRALSQSDRPREARALQRDRLDYERITFPPMPIEKSDELLTWWRDTLVFGGAWFSAPWPLPRGLVTAVRKFREQPRWEFVPGGFWRLSALCEVRGRGELPTDGGDPYFSNVGYLLHMDGASPYVFTDVKGNLWDREATGAPDDFQVNDGNPKFGDGALLMRTATGTSEDYGITAAPLAGAYALQAGNKFTLEGWLWWTGDVDSRISVGAVLSDTPVFIGAIEFNTTSQLRFRTHLDALDDRLVTPPLSQWVHLELGYDGTTKYWFVNGVLQGSAVLPAGVVKTVSEYRCRGTASGNVFAPIARVDDLRFTFDVCRHTASFPPPTAPFPDF